MNDIQFFEQLESGKNFTDSALACSARFGARFISLTPEPFVLKLRGETFSVIDGKIIHEKE